MAFGASVLRLVLGEPRTIDDDPAPAVAEPLEAADAIDIAPFPASDEALRDELELERLKEPGFADIEAAVALVSAGLTKRVVLTSFAAWPGLLWRAYELAEDANVLILPTVVREGGLVDIVVTSELE